MPKLKTEINTPKMEERVRLAFQAWSSLCEAFSTHYEHGQWWVKAEDPADDKERTYSVIDATGGCSVDGFDFEEV